MKPLRELTQEDFNRIYSRCVGLAIDEEELIGVFLKNTGYCFGFSYTKAKEPVTLMTYLMEYDIGAPERSYRIDRFRN